MLREWHPGGSHQQHKGAGRPWRGLRLQCLCRTAGATAGSSPANGCLSGSPGGSGGWGRRSPRFNDYYKDDSGVKQGPSLLHWYCCTGTAGCLCHLCQEQP